MGNNLGDLLGLWVVFFLKDFWILFTPGLLGEDSSKFDEVI